MNPTGHYEVARRALYYIGKLLTRSDWDLWTQRTRYRVISYAGAAHTHQKDPTHYVPKRPPCVDNLKDIPR